jgi:predicted dehydrogenase
MGRTARQPGSDAAQARPALVWLRREQATLIAPVLAALNLKVWVIGDPTSDRARDALEDLRAAGAACDEHVETATDLRAALAVRREGVVILADPGEFGRGEDAARGTLERETIAACHERGVRVISMEPIPATLQAMQGVGAPTSLPQVLRPGDLGPTGDPSESGGSALLGVGGMGAWAYPAPLWRRSAPVQDTLTMLEQFGPVRTCGVQVLGSPHEGSLGARLFDALDLVQMLMGEPDRIDAAYIAPGAGALRAVHPLPGETLRGLHGDLTANLRFAGGRGATITASNQSGRFEFSMVLVGERGRIRVDQSGLEWTDSDGRVVDRSRTRPSRSPRTPRTHANLQKPSARRAGDASTSHDAAEIESSSPPRSEAVGPLAEQIRRYLQEGTAAATGLNYSRVLAMAQAALLSARTGEAESPATLMRLAHG